MGCEIGAFGKPPQRVAQQRFVDQFGGAGRREPRAEIAGDRV
jgi:hypothetical protein